VVDNTVYTLKFNINVNRWVKIYKGENPKLKVIRAMVGTWLLFLRQVKVALE
jgi:hypothetical protein